VSRAVIGEARTTLPGTQVVEVTASEPVLARRLAARGRGDDGDLHQRLARARALPDVAPDLRIVNEGPPEAGADHFVAFLLARAAHPASRLATA
jgi:ribose 1,5-bisphosphokinase